MHDQLIELVLNQPVLPVLVRGFSEEERAEIRKDLLRVGREQFLTYGPERTRVKDITDPVGIAKPTFYQFFDSKGELYLEILARETDELAARLRDETTSLDDPAEALERLFTAYREYIEHNPDLQQVLSEHHPRELFRNVPHERIEAARAHWFDVHLPVIRDIQAKSDGSLAERDSREILGLLRPIAVMQMYRERGTTRSPEEFDRLQRIHIETLVRGLIHGDPE